MARNVLIYLSKNSLQFFAPGMENAAKLALPSSVVKDLEVVDADLLEKTITEFKFKQKVTPTEAIMILSTDATFDKNFSSTEAGFESAKQSFLEATPFEEVNSKEIVNGDDRTVVVTNRNFYSAVKSAWEKTGGKVVMVIPEVLLPKKPEKFNIRKIASITGLLQRPSALHDLSLINVVESAPAQIRHQASRQFAINKNLRLLVPLLLVAILILLGVWFWSHH